MVEKFDSPAEELILEAGIVTKRSPTRREVFQCMGCRFLRAENLGMNPRVYGWQIVNCTGLTTGQVDAHLRELYDGGVVKRVDPATAAPADNAERSYYIPSDTEIGQEVLLHLRVPRTCLYEIMHQDE